MSVTPYPIEMARSAGPTKMPGGGDGSGGLFRCLDHRDDHGVGSGIEHPADGCGCGGRQPYRGADRQVLAAAQHERHVGVVDVAVLGVESDVVVAGVGVLLRADEGGPDDPAAPYPLLLGKSHLQSVRGTHRVITIFTRSGTGRQASSKAAWTSSAPNVWVM